MTRRALLLVLLAAGLAMGQRPSEPPRHDKYRDDPKAYCLPAKPAQNDTHGHECHCALVCANGEPAEQTTCELYCTKSHCACHPDAPCEGRQDGPVA